MDWNQSAILFLKPSASPDGREKDLFEGSLAGAVARLKGQVPSGDMPSDHVIWTASFVYSEESLTDLLSLHDIMNGGDIAKSANSAQ